MKNDPILLSKTQTSLVVAFESLSLYIVGIQALRLEEPPDTVSLSWLTGGETETRRVVLVDSVALFHSLLSLKSFHGLPWSMGEAYKGYSLYLGVMGAHLSSQHSGLRVEDGEFQASIDYVVRSEVKTKANIQTGDKN